MLLKRSELEKYRREWQSEGKRVVFTNGCFDLLHVGHVRYLQEARSLGDLLVVGLNSDASVRQLKGPARPLVNQAERAELLLALRPVDHVVIFEERTAEKVLSELRPAVYVKGGDYTTSPGQAASNEGKPLPEAAIVRAYGGEVVLIQYLDGHSTSSLIKRIRLERVN